MTFFLDEHKVEHQSFPEGTSNEDFVAKYKEFEKACVEHNVVAHGAFVNTGDSRAYCLTEAPSEEAVRKAHEAVNFPYSEITEIKRVSGMDLLLNLSD